MNFKKRLVITVWLLVCECFLIRHLCGDITQDKIQFAIDKGLKYLLKSQNQKTGQIGNTNYHVATTALGGLAMFAAGYTPYAGKFGMAIEKATQHILKNQRKNGYITEDTNSSWFHGHSYALIFLTYVYSELRNSSSLLDRDDLKQKIKKAVKILEDSQLSDGGFPYSPGDNMAENSTVVCCVSALRSAKDAGFKVKEKVVKKGIDYIRKCANPDGSFAYNLGQRDDRPIMTVNGMMNLIFYGSWKDSDLIKKGFNKVKRLYETGDLFQGWDMEYYGTFYAALALYYTDEELWKKWFSAVSEKLISAQRDDGSWAGSSSNYGIATQFALLILQIPKKLLPLFVK
jgi:hypothetical protein